MPLLIPTRITPAIRTTLSLTIFCEFHIEVDPSEYSIMLIWIRVPYSGQDFGHTETRKQEAVTGEYHVLLPDDRLQIVRYTADQNGYVADVKYSDGSTSPAYGKSGSSYSSNRYTENENNQYSRGYSNDMASVKTSSYFNPSPKTGYNSASQQQKSGLHSGYNNQQHTSNIGSYLQGNQAFKSGCICQCPQ